MDWRQHITADPAVLGGKPVVRGTRLAVDFILGLFAAGWSTEEIMGNYDGISPEALKAVFAFAAESLSDGTLYPLRRETA